MVLCCWTELQSQVRGIAEALLVVGVTWVNLNLINIENFFVKYNSFLFCLLIGIFACLPGSLQIKSEFGSIITQNLILILSFRLV